MEIDRVCKYCHVSAYVAYENCSPVYKKTFIDFKKNIIEQSQGICYQPLP